MTLELFRLRPPSRHTKTSPTLLLLTAIITKLYSYQHYISLRWCCFADSITRNRLRQNNGSFEAFVILCYYTEYGRNSGWKSKLKRDIYCQNEVVKSFIKLRLWNGVGSYCNPHDKQTEFLSARLKDAFAAGSYTRIHSGGIAVIYEGHFEY